VHPSSESIDTHAFTQAMSGSSQLVAFTGAVILGAAAAALWINHLREQLCLLTQDIQLLSYLIDERVTDPVTLSDTCCTLVPPAQSASDSTVDEVKVPRTVYSQNCDDIYIPDPSICSSVPTCVLDHDEYE